MRVVCTAAVWRATPWHGRATTTSLLQQSRLERWGIPCVQSMWARKMGPRARTDERRESRLSWTYAKQGGGGAAAPGSHRAVNECTGGHQDTPVQLAVQERIVLPSKAFDIYMPVKEACLKSRLHDSLRHGHKPMASLVIVECTA